MSKSTPINQLLNNNNNNLVDEILNEIEPTIESTNIEETQKREQKQMEEKMKEHIEEQKRQEEYNKEQVQDHEEYQQEYNKEQVQGHEEYQQEEQDQEQEEYKELEEEYKELEDEEYIDNNVEESQEINVSNPISNKSYVSKGTDEKCKEKGLVERLIDNIKPTFIVIILTMCVLSNISTQMIDKLLPQKEIIIKYHIIIMIVLKSLISGIIFFISNLLL